MLDCVGQSERVLLNYYENLFVILIYMCSNSS